MCSFVQTEGWCENQEKGQGSQVQNIFVIFWWRVVRTEKSIRSGCLKAVHALFKATLSGAAEEASTSGEGVEKERAQWDSFFIFIFI